MGIIGDIFGGKTKQSTNVALSPEQKALTQQQVELGKFQKAELERQRQAQETLFNPATTQAENIEQSLGNEITQTIPGALPQAQIPGATPGPTAPDRLLASTEFSDELAQLQLDRIKAGGQATQEEIDLINSATERALASGETDINRFLQTGLEQLREELAPQLGLRPGDTPVLDRGSRVVAEGTRQQGQLVNSLRGQQAQSQLNFPLARASAIGGLTQAQQALAEQGLQFNSGLGLAGAQLAEQQRQFTTGAGEVARQFDFGATEQSRQFQEQQGNAIRDFKAQLQQSAFINRLQLAGGQATAGLGLAGVSAPNIGPAFSAVSSSGTGRDPSQGLLNLTEGFSNVAGGVTSILGASSRDWKDTQGPVDGKEILAALMTLPVDRWTYKGEDKDHIGTFAEDFQKAFNVGDGKHINLMDAIGVLTAAVKELAEAQDGNIR